MSILTSQTGANFFNANQFGGAEELPNDLHEFPRFLFRDEMERTANTPPPLPRVAWYVRVQWMMRHVAPHKMAAPAAAFVVLMPAAAALVLDKGPAQIPSLIPPQINVILVKSIVQVPAQVFAIAQTSAGLEERLGFGPSLANANGETQTAPTFGDRHAEANLPPADPTDPPDSPALLILRNLPENVTFTTGEPAGKGQWVIAAGGPNQLDMTLGEGFERPVAADVELVSHAGLTLGLLHLELHRSVAALAEAQPAPALQEPVSLAETETADPKEEAKDAEAKPRKRVRRAADPSKSKFARADGGYVKRIRKADRWKTKMIDAPGSGEEPSNAIAKADAPKDETAQGPIAKFFSWLKGDGNKTAPDDAPGSEVSTGSIGKAGPEENKAAMFPQ